MESLGVSERNSYEWSSPIWGQQYPCQNIFHPPPPTCVSINSTTVKKKEEEEEEPKKEVILHDCEAEGKGKKRGKRPKKPSKKKPKKKPKKPKKKHPYPSWLWGPKSKSSKKKKSAKSLRALAKGKTKGKPISILGLIS